MTRILAAFFALALSATAAIPQISGNFASGTVAGNSSAAARPGRVEMWTAMQDRALCSTTNAAQYRNGTVWTCLLSGNNGVWTTGGTGIPAISSTLPTAVQDNITRLGTIVSGVWTGTAIANANLANMAQATIKGRASGAGTGVPVDLTAVQAQTAIFPTPSVAGDIFYWNGSAWTILGGNSSGTRVLQETSSGVPSWVVAGTGTVTSVTLTAGNGITVAGTCPSAITTTGSCAITNSGIGQIVRQVFAAGATYTPTTGMLYADFEAWGGGGGGGGVTGSASGVFGGSPGGNGGYSRCRLTAAQIGASKAIVVGAAGAGSAGGNNAGSAGTDSTVGVTLCVAKGGSGGDFSNTGHAPGSGAGGVAGTGDMATAGNTSPPGIHNVANTNVAYSACANPTTLGGGVGAAVANSSSAAGTSAAANTGNGGCGGISANSTGTPGGGNGGTGYVVVTEYVKP